MTCVPGIAAQALCVTGLGAATFPAPIQHLYEEPEQAPVPGEHLLLLKEEAVFPVETGQMAGELVLRPPSPCRMESLSYRGTCSPDSTPAAPHLQSSLLLLHPATQTPPVYLGLYLGSTGMQRL